MPDRKITQASDYIKRRLTAAKREGQTFVSKVTSYANCRQDFVSCDGSGFFLVACLLSQSRDTIKLFAIFTNMIIIIFYIAQSSEHAVHGEE